LTCVVSVSVFAQVESPPEEVPAAPSSVEKSADVTNIHASRKFGLGLGTGISAKYFLNNTLAVQGFAGFYFGLSTNLGVDVMYQGKQLWTNGDLSLNWEAGGGAGVWLWNAGLYGAASVSICGVAGLSLQYRPIPLELTADIRPTFVFGNFGGFGFAPFRMDFGGAIRYYF
jgi:hypothetical protein